MTRGFLDAESGVAGDGEVERADLVDIEAEVLNETDKAWLVFDGAVMAWLPKSAVERDGLTFTLPGWMAREKRLAPSAEHLKGARLL